MKAGGRCAVAALTMAIAVGGCASGDPGDPGTDEVAVATASPTPSPPPSASPEPGRGKTRPAPDGPAKVLIVKAFRKMQRAFERKDARAILRHTGPLTIRYLKQTRRATASADRDEIMKLSVWQKLALTTLRTDLDEDEIAGLSNEDLLGYVFEYELDSFPSGRLRKRFVHMNGPRAATVATRGSLLWFTVVDGEWKVEVLGGFENVSRVTKEYAEKEGLTIHSAILGLAEHLTKDVVPGDVWQEP
ncbi:MAG: hypothetical protein M3134_11330 [Actinomycetota bacterium]|nr:hypothetical protein [Actinomycetota bacterium]